MTVAFITHRECFLHEMGAGHPQCPDRLGAIEDRLIASRLDWLLVRAEAPEATREQLLCVHAGASLDSLEHIAPRSGLVGIDPDTAMNAHTLPAALRAAGAAVLATDLVIARDVDAAFCSVRPPGAGPRPSSKAQRPMTGPRTSPALFGAYVTPSHRRARVAAT